jgi:hypothetical protein
MKSKPGGQSVAPGGSITQPLKKLAGGNLADLATRRKTVESYIMTTTMDGRTYTQSMRMKGGKPLRMKMDMARFVKALQ